MKKKFLNYSISLIQNYKKYSEEEIEKLNYGLEGLYLTITKLIIIFIIAIILNIVKELVILLLFFNVIRYFAFGLHMNKSYICLISSILLIIGLCIISKHINLNYLSKIIINTFVLLNIVFFAPSDTPKRPLTNKKKRIIRKILSILVCIIYIGLSFLLNNNLLNNLILSSLIIQTILINPITYKIFNVRYNNYKKVS